ncbi:hypothetical protein Trydic_g14796 [Trypoxylus dichotomus]
MFPTRIFDLPTYFFPVRKKRNRKKRKLLLSGSFRDVLKVIIGGLPFPSPIFQLQTRPSTVSEGAKSRSATSETTTDGNVVSRSRESSSPGCRGID